MFFTPDDGIVRNNTRNVYAHMPAYRLNKPQQQPNEQLQPLVRHTAATATHMGAGDATEVEDKTLGGLYSDRRIIALPNGFVRPNPFTVLGRCVRECVFTFFLFFASGIAVTDPENSPSTTANALAVSFTLPQFIVQMASYGTVGNPWFLLMNMILVTHESNAFDELLFLFMAVLSELGGACLAMWWVFELRGSVSAYIPRSVGVSDFDTFMLEFVYCFFYGYIFLKLVRTSPRSEAPIIETPWAPVAVAMYSYMGILTLAPFTGAGINLLRNVAPSLIAWQWDVNVWWSILGQGFGYSLAALTFMGLYMHPSMPDTLLANNTTAGTQPQTEQRRRRASCCTRWCLANTNARKHASPAA